MDTVTLAALRSWDLRPGVIAALLLAAAVYTRGWQHLHADGRVLARSAAGKRRLAAYWSGILVLLLALVSPIDVLSGQLFAIHMVQHLLLVMLAPPLLLLGNPFPTMLWGLPDGLRRGIGLLFRPDSSFRRALAGATRPGRVWFAFVAVFLGWHDPNAYNLALRSEWVHDLEHISFTLTAMLFWWKVIPAGPRLHPAVKPGLQIAYLAAAIPVNMLSGIAIAFSQTPIYSYYNAVPRLWGLSVMEDQMLGGTIMWIPGSMMFLAAAFIIATRFLQQEERRVAGQIALEVTR